MATTYDLTGTTLEFLYSYTGTYAGTSSATIVAFGSASSIVSAAISGSSTYGQTIDAGAYGYLFDKTTAINSPTYFDLGYSSSAAASSTYSGSNGALVSGTSPASASNATEGYGALELSSAAFAGASAISFKGGSNTLILDTASGLANPGLTGFSAAGDQVVFKGIAASTPHILSFTYAAGGSTLTFGNGAASSSITLYGLASTTTAGNFALGSGALVEGGNTSTYAGTLVLSFVPCFLRGTMIDTPFGERPVEELREGDLVTALVDGRPMPRAVRWTGGGEMDATLHAFRDSAFPVRIRRDAFACGMPTRDLLVTPEHCLLTDAGLVPARMLVNGASIVIDRDLIRYDYFHVELDDHSILLSEGLPTESYLDGENRAHLDRAAAAPAGTPPAGLAAPLAVSRAQVEPIWTALNNRAVQIGMTAPATAGTVMTDDPGLRLLLDDGSEIAACRRDSQRHMFQIPRGVRPVRLRSRASVPSEVIGPFVDDRRRLGVAVDRMVLWAGLDERVMPAGAAGALGWHEESTLTRWTDGDAEIDVPASDEDRFLDIHVAATMPYRAA